jgi:hypothetical protein
LAVGYNTLRVGFNFAYRAVQMQPNGATSRHLGCNPAKIEKGTRIGTEGDRSTERLQRLKPQPTKTVVVTQTSNTRTLKTGLQPVPFQLVGATCCAPAVKSLAQVFHACVAKPVCWAWQNANASYSWNWLERRWLSHRLIQPPSTSDAWPQAQGLAVELKEGPPGPRLRRGAHRS